MKKITAIILTAILLIATLSSVSAEEAKAAAPLFELKLDSADVVTKNIALDGEITEVSYDATENAMRVGPASDGKAPARFRVTYPTGDAALIADKAPIITALVKAPKGFSDKMLFSTRTSATGDAKSAGALLGETGKKVETWGVKADSVKTLEVGDGYSLLMVDLNEAVGYATKSDGTRMELVKDATMLSSFIDLLPYSGWTFDASVHFFVKSVCVFATEQDALGYFGAKAPEKVETGAYTVGNDYVSFWQTDDTRYFAAESSWKLKNVDGAMGGDALFCEKQGASAAGSGFTFTFVVPTEGDYTIWGRVFYPSQSANSLHYSVDGGKAQIWDFPDEDAADSKCYNSWQYFYLTQRKAGTYTDSAKYGSWTIGNGEYRHSPNVLHLTAGQHTIKLVGREAGMYIDELIVTSYSVDKYDPNACDGNTTVLDVCKFCGSDVKHYCTDVYAAKGTSAQTYFTTVLHTDAQSWTIPEVEIEVPVDTGTDTEDVIDEDNKGKVPNIGPVDEETEDTEDTVEATADTAADTVGDTEETPDEKGGCGAAVGSASLMLAAIASTMCVIAKKKRED